MSKGFVEGKGFAAHAGAVKTDANRVRDAPAEEMKVQR
ncbi:hypothetical protein BLAT2472_80298 [Burkholderia latens]